MARLVCVATLLLVLTAPTALAQEGTSRGEIVQGTCGSLGNTFAELAAPLFPEGEPTGASKARTAGTSFTVAPLSLSGMLAEPLVLVSLDGHRVACADIGGTTNAAGDLVIGLTGVADSDAFGIAYMSPNDADPSQTDISLFVVPPTSGRPDASTRDELARIG